MRTDVKETTVYQFAELSDTAKETARQWWRDCENQDFGASGFEFEPAETAANILGIEFHQNTVKLMGGSTRQKPDIRYSGFSSQGDGASFTGYYYYAKGCSKAIRAEFPTDKTLHAIADGLTALQRKHGYKLTAKITQSGHYCHQFTMCAEVENDGRDVTSETENELQDLLRDFAGWIYKGLEAEYDYRMSDANVDESIAINEYEFTENGNRY